MSPSSGSLAVSTTAVVPDAAPSLTVAVGACAYGNDGGSGASVTSMVTVPTVTRPAVSSSVTPSISVPAVSWSSPPDTTTALDTQWIRSAGRRRWVR